MTFTKTTISGSTATGSHGGVIYSGATTSNTVAFSGNTAADPSSVATSTAGTYGGAIYLTGPTNTITTDAHTSFSTSTAGNSGGVIYIAGTGT